MREAKKETKAKKSTVKKSTAAETKKKKTIEKATVKAENKKEKSILSVKEKKYYKILCRVVQVITKIIRICLMICVPFIFLFMILVPIVLKNFEVNANIVKFGDISTVIRDDSISVKIGEDVHVIECSSNEANRVMTFLSENSKTAIIMIVELSLLLCGVILIMEIYLFVYLEKLFNNLIKDDTPFNSENARYILLIGIIISAIKVVDICLEMAGLLTLSNGSLGIVSILIIFVLYFVFKYAAGIQKKVDTKICD